MDIARLRNVLKPLITGLKDMETHERLPILCEKLGMPPPDFQGSKRDRMRATFDAILDEDLPRVALKYLELYPPAAAVRNEIQDIIWAGSSPEIPIRYRRELTRLLSSDDLFTNVIGFDQLLERLWIMGPADELAALLGLRDESLRADVNQHVYRNPGDWTVE